MELRLCIIALRIHWACFMLVACCVHCMSHGVFSCWRQFEQEYETEDKSCRVVKSNSICSEDAAVNTGSVVGVEPTKEKIEVPGCRSILKSWTKGISCVALLFRRMLIWSLPDARGSFTYVAADGYAIKSRIAHRPGGLKWSVSEMMTRVLTKSMVV